MKEPIYLKIWQGVISNSFAGRDDGYPETKYQVFTNIFDLAKNFGKNNDERYYQLQSVDNEKLEIIVKIVLEEDKRQQKDVEKQKKMEQYLKLKEELNL